MRGGVLRENGETGFLIDLASSEAGAWDWDMRDERPLWSIETFRQFGLDPAGGVPPFREWLERCVHPEDHEHCERRALAVLAGDETAFKLEYRIVNRECSLDETVDKVFAIMVAEKSRMDWQPVAL